VSKLKKRKKRRMSTLASDAAHIQSGGTSAWPENACLFQPYEGSQISLPDFANCLTVKAFLRMCDLSFKLELRENAEYMSPSGKVPFIRLDRLLISEADPIISHINMKGQTLSDSLSEVEKSDMRAFISMVNNILGKAELYMAWCESKVSEEITIPRYGYSFPWPLNRIIPWKKQREIKKSLNATGWLNKSLDEVCDEVTTCCQALSEKLGDKTYFFGDKPSELDAVVYGHLFTIITTELPVTSLADIVDSFENLGDFCTRIDDKYFKEHELTHES